MLILFIVHDNYDRILFSPTKSRKVLAEAKVKKEDLGYKLPVFKAHLFEGSQWFISKSNCSSGTNPTARHVTYACKWTVWLPTKGTLPYCRSESGSKGPESTCILITCPGTLLNHLLLCSWYSERLSPTPELEQTYWWWRGKRFIYGKKIQFEQTNVHRIFNEVIFLNNNLTLSVCCKTFIDLTS